MLTHILNNIEQYGYSIQDNIFQPNILDQIHSDVLAAYHNNSLKKAGIGRETQVHSEIRGDFIQWLTEWNLTDSQREIWKFLSQLKSELNRNLFLGLKDFETHLTIYPKQTFYKKHIDQFKNSTEKARKISFILYLNKDWGQSDGGELVLYSSSDSVLEKVSPTFGKTVIFLSEEFPHEVLETQKERVSLTGWFHT